ncbi:MAG: cytochrome C oxidase subunit IV family protein [Candidatus Thiodiazotropha lotti]|uniref:Cytochrome C oxidase subunit IV family protein n=1 Tax=Candidatus Thiodiazotropha lotti TaxID=2792787 RepID=A0A9E4K8K3_9GAMM|nr:cytochrome C oxidase subunit IV family protein [Candidatus Thiodiazotropha lotti]ODC01114.1 O-succinylhomoserine sulfhydrylase [Candidatus Thiodiazotropha endoloripes]MCG7920869.1 cytochrome C oxidase subunit IV family protein [Candidatus Thiodiazotropha lotti]MCG7930140.1 cytochrome C oxidase subunit IV family protein [Candidatus Thiodiazotropha lotti]MCG7940838.1 cytochrome C oxidase subunit IV family protein [Candidatus Thiodiazotropha lotti]
MKRLSELLGIRPCTLIYLLLISFSLTTFLVAKMGFSGLGLSLMVLFLALIKGQLVGSYFMGLGRVRGIWRWPVFIWLFIPGILIGMAFYLSYP